MLSLKIIREDIKRIKDALKSRGMQGEDLDRLLHIDSMRRDRITEVQALKEERNLANKKIGELRRSGKDTAREIERLREVSDRIKEIDAEVRSLESKIDAILLSIPNLPHPTTPFGHDDSDNPCIKTWGEKPNFPFPPLSHYELGERLGILDFKRAAKISGARFVLYKGVGALLERALINFMIDIHTRERGYTELLPPFMVNTNSMVGTGQLPKFEEDLFKIQGEDYYLIPTAEVPVTNIHRGEVLQEEDLPLRYTAYTPCFRAEAGSYGKDVRGLIRQHQFNKVELVKFTRAEDSYSELESLLLDAEEVLKRLKLHYRVVVLCTGDLGFAASKTYDIEVWVPSQDTYREISSCSNFEDFQARRAGIRYRPRSGGKTRYVHTLNGSALAIGRTVVAILENYQTEDHHVIIPEALRPYMGGIETI